MNIFHHISFNFFLKEVLLQDVYLGTTNIYNFPNKNIIIYMLLKSMYARKENLSCLKFTKSLQNLFLLPNCRRCGSLKL